MKSEAFVGQLRGNDLSEPGAIATGFRDDQNEKNPVAIAPGSDKEVVAGGRLELPTSGL